MQHALLIAALAAALAGPALAEKAGHDHAPKHGGVLVEGKAADFELVARPDALHLYVSDHGKPMDLAQTTARLTLLNGTDKQEVPLQPADGKLEAVGTFKVSPGTKAVAVVHRSGKPLGTARFTLK